MNGRLIGWASSEQYKMRISDGVSEASGGTLLSPILLLDKQSLVLVDASAAEAFLQLPPPSNQNKSATLTIARQAGANTISVRYLSKGGSSSQTLGTNPTSSLTLISTGEYWEVIATVDIP